MKLSRKKRVYGSAAVLLLTIVGAAWALGAFRPLTRGVGVQAAEADARLMPVKTIRPKRDPALQVAVEQLARVEPYYRADLRARVAGVVKYVAKDIGAEVRRGELLVEIDVPDLHQE